MGSAMNNQSSTRTRRFSRLSENVKSIIVFSSAIILIGLCAVALS